MSVARWRHLALASGAFEWSICPPSHSFLLPLQKPTVSFAADAAATVDYALLAIQYRANILTDVGSVPDVAACSQLCNSYGSACSSFSGVLSGTGNSFSCQLSRPYTAGSTILAGAGAISGIQAQNGFAILHSTSLGGPFVQEIAFFMGTTIANCPALCSEISYCSYATFYAIYSNCALYRGGESIDSASLIPSVTTFFFVRANLQL